MSSPLGTSTRRFLLGSAGLLATLWLLEISGALVHRGIARGVAIACALALVVFLVLSIRSLLIAPRGPDRTRALALAAVLVAAFAIRFVGLDFELMDQPIGDEGVFHEVSQSINRGEPLPKTFNYGHFLYYAGAFAIWLYDLFPVALTWLLELFYTTVEGYGVQRILLKGVNATLSALAAGAVFGAAYRVAGRVAGRAAGRVAGGVAGQLDPSSDFARGPQPLVGAIFAAALIVFSPIYNSVAHELIADVPAAALAAFALYFVSRLLERETLGDYLLAGIAAGLAAASKYPGGLVAVAIFGVWLDWRIRRRDWSWDLLWAAAASMGAMVVAMPALLVHAETAFRGEGLDIFFGFRQYARGGWLGVQPDSNLIWYGRHLVWSFGLPALALGALGGVALLAPEQRRRWLLMSVFPATYLVLIFSMTMVVRRNLQVSLPALAILIGVGVAAVVSRVGGRKLTGAAVSVLALALPVWRTSTWTISQTRPGTRQLAREWVAENVPEGASLIRERYTPELDEDTHAFVTRRFAAWIDPEELQSGEWDYLILAEPSYSRFLEAKSFRREYQEEYKRRYLRMLELPRVVEFPPSALTSGPLLTIHQVQPDEPNYLRERLFLPDEATFISHPDLRRDGPGKPLQYTFRWQFAVFKDFFAAGKYRVKLGMNPAPKDGYLHVVDRNNREVGTFQLAAQPGADLQITLPADEKYLLRVFIAPPTRLYGLQLSPDKSVD